MLLRRPAILGTLDVHGRLLGVYLDDWQSRQTWMWEALLHGGLMGDYSDDRQSRESLRDPILGDWSDY